MFTKETYIQRRAALKKAVGSGLLLFLGNDEQGLNYEDNTFRYRQDSTFLYFFGISAAGLSAIGMGVAPPSPEWGAMLNYATDYYKTAPHLIVCPAVAIILTALAINLVGDGLRDALDPKSMK